MIIDLASTENTKDIMLLEYILKTISLNIMTAKQLHVPLEMYYHCSVNVD